MHNLPNSQHHIAKLSINRTLLAFLSALLLCTTLAPNAAKAEQIKITLKNDCLLWKSTDLGLHRVHRQAYEGEQFMATAFFPTRVYIDLRNSRKVWLKSTCKISKEKEPKTKPRKKARKKTRKPSQMNCPPMWYTLLVKPFNAHLLNVTVRNGKVIKRERGYCLSPRIGRVLLERLGYHSCIFRLPKGTAFVTANIRKEEPGNQLPSDYCIKP